MRTQKEEGEDSGWRKDHRSGERSLRSGKSMEKMPGGAQRPWPVMSKTGRYEQLLTINNFFPSLPGLAAISLLKREFKT